MSLISQFILPASLKASSLVSKLSQSQLNHSRQLVMKSPFRDSFQRFSGGPEAPQQEHTKIVNDARSRIAGYESNPSDSYMVVKYSFAHLREPDFLQSRLNQPELFANMSKVAQSALLQVLDDPDAAKASTVHLMPEKKISKKEEVEVSKTEISEHLKNATPFNPEVEERAFEDEILKTIPSDVKAACAREEYRQHIDSMSKSVAAYRWRTSFQNIYLE